MPATPYGAGTPANPFTAKPLPQSNMVNNAPATNAGKPGGGINVDDLVKRIDAKIAELEEEEKMEKEKMAKQADEKQDIPKPPVQTIKPPIITPEQTNVNPNSNIKPNVSDDQFFDDFFGED
jgi:hypothetical protein